MLKLPAASALFLPAGIVVVAIVNSSLRVAAQEQATPVFVEYNGPRFKQNSEGVELWAGPGWLRTQGFFGSFALRFEYRLLEPKSHAVLITRARFQPAPNRRGADRGYLIHLTNPGSGAEALGRATAINLSLNQLTFTPVAGDDAERFDRWRTVELVINRQELSVRVDGSETFRANGLEDLDGVVGFQTRRGGVQVRQIMIDRPPPVIGQFRSESGELISVVGPQLLQEVQPEYPPEALRRKAQGEVLLEVVVQTDGTVGEVRVLKPLRPDLDSSAIAAARKWKFKPAQLLDGKPVATWVTIVMRFRIE